MIFYKNPKNPLLVSRVALDYCHTCGSVIIESTFQQKDNKDVFLFFNDNKCHSKIVGVTESDFPVIDRNFETPKNKDFLLYPTCDNKSAYNEYKNSNKMIEYRDYTFNTTTGTYWKEVSIGFS